MFDTLILENYKSYKKLELNDLKRINLIAGMNNTGKTSILEAIFMQHDRLAGDVFLRPLFRRGVQQVEVKPEYIFHPYFHDFNIDKPFVITTKGGGFKDVATYTMVSAKSKTMAVNQNNLPMNSVLSSASTFKNAVEIRYLSNNDKKGMATLQIVNNQLEMNLESVSPAFRTAVFVPASARGNSLSDADFISQLDMANGLDEFVKYLKMIDSKLRGVSLLSLGGQPTLYVDVGLKRKIPMVQMGEGISKLTSILTAILSNQNAVILIDEIENGIHYSLMPKIWKIIFSAATRQKSQVFITTHSQDVINGVSECFKENPYDKYEDVFSYIRLDKNDNGEIIPKHYGAASLVASVERDWDIR